MEHDVARHVLMPREEVGHGLTAACRLLEVVLADGGTHDGKTRAAHQAERGLQSRQVYRFGQDGGAGGAIGVGGKVVAADKHGAEAGVLRREGLAQREAVHRLHDDIRHQRIDAPP